MSILPIILFKSGTHINFMKYKKAAYFFSIMLTIVTIISLFTKGLNFGIDFAGGVMMEIDNTQNTASVETTRKILEEQGYESIVVQQVNDRIMIRLHPKNITNYNVEMQAVKELLSKENPNTVFRKIEYVGPKVGSQLVTKGVTAMIFTLIAMMIYVTCRFNWIFGLGIIIALLHDIIATIGFYVISGFEFDLTSIAAILTIVGYSVNDSVVIYDRIRENIKKTSQKNFGDIVNLSLNETLSRTTMTVTTTLIVCLSLIMFSGINLRGFSSALFFGIAFGTYSSIFISAPLLLILNKNKNIQPKSSAYKKT